MDFIRNFTQSDLFNYYIGGTFWILDAYLLWKLVFPKSQLLERLLASSQGFPEALAFGILGVLVPYVVGFAMTGLAETITGRLRRDYFAVCLGKKPQKGIMRLSGELVEQIQGRFSRLFGLSMRPHHFWWIRSYVLQHGGASVDLATRALMMSNLAESLLLPFPIFTGLILAVALQDVSPQTSILLPVIGFITGAIPVFFLVKRRYLRLYEQAVKHTYRAFWVITQDKEAQWQLMSKSGNG